MWVWRYIIYIATMAYIVLEVELYAAFPDCNLHYRQTSVITRFILLGLSDPWQWRLLRAFDRPEPLT